MVILHRPLKSVDVNIWGLLILNKRARAGLVIQRLYLLLFNLLRPLINNLSCWRELIKSIE